MGALAGVKVLDVATLFPAPLLAAMLGDFGADVVKVEPRDGDPLRAIGAVPWAVAGRNKRSVRIDFETTDGLELLHELIGVADVIVFNQPRGLLERWECTDDQITARNARAVVVHLTAFGQTGPYANRTGNGTLAEAFVGLPIGSVPLGDSMAAVTGVIGVLTALYWRDAHDGHGQVVDVSLFESLLPLLAPAIAGLAPRTVRSLPRRVRGGRRSVGRHLGHDRRTARTAADRGRGRRARLGALAAGGECGGSADRRAGTGGRGERRPAAPRRRPRRGP